MSPITPAAPPPREHRPLRCLVTGGAGFIGSHLVDHLLAAGCHATVVDDLSTGRRANLPAAHPRLDFIHADLGDYLAGPGAAARFDRAFHLAAAVGVKLVIDEPVRAIETNVGLTSALLTWALTHGPAGGPLPVLVASSSEVYGKSERCPFAEDDDVVYGPTTKGRWAYAMSKALDEHLALAHHGRSALPVVVARFFNTVGPRQVGTYGMVLPRFVAAALAGHDLLVHGDGAQTRCLCDVRDVAPALLRLLDTPACAGRVFNLGSDRPVSMLDLAARVVRVLASPSRVRTVPYDAVYGKGFEDLRRRQPDLTRIKAAIGFQPRFDLDDTIRDLAASLCPPAAVPVSVPSARPGHTQPSTL